MKGKEKKKSNTKISREIDDEDTDRQTRVGMKLNILPLVICFSSRARAFAMSHVHDGESETHARRTKNRLFDGESVETRLIPTRRVALELRARGYASTVKASSLPSTSTVRTRDR